MKAIEKHFYRSLEMLEDLTEICPAEIWEKPRPDGVIFWRQVYHAFFGVEFWFRTSNDGVSSYYFGKNVTPDLEENSEGSLPKEDMPGYITEIREKCRNYFSFLREKGEDYPSPVYWKLSLEDMVLMQIRHIQHHVGYLNRVLTENGINVASWRGSGD